MNIWIPKKYIGSLVHILTVHLECHEDAEKGGGLLKNDCDCSRDILKKLTN